MYFSSVCVWALWGHGTLPTLQHDDLFNNAQNTYKTNQPPPRIKTNVLQKSRSPDFKKMIKIIQFVHIVTLNKIALFSYPPSPPNKNARIHLYIRPRALLSCLRKSAFSSLPLEWGLGGACRLSFPHPVILLFCIISRSHVAPSRKGRKGAFWMLAVGGVWVLGSRQSGSVLIIHQSSLFPHPTILISERGKRAQERRGQGCKSLWGKILRSFTLASALGHSRTHTHTHAFSQTDRVL